MRSSLIKSSEVIIRDHALNVGPVNRFESGKFGKMALSGAHLGNVEFISHRFANKKSI